MPRPGALARKPTTYTPQVVRALAQIEADLGGRQALIGMLVLAPLTPDLKYVLSMLGDPQQVGASLATICAEGNLLPGDLLQHLASAALLRGKVAASREIAQGIAEVAKDVMRRAAPYEEVCHACLGTGTHTPDPSPTVPNPLPGPCDTCAATGRLRYLPDLERQKLAIDMAHLLPKGGGINIAQINAPSGQGGGAAGLTTFDRVLQATDKILYDRPLEELDPPSDAVEGEAVEGEVDDVSRPE